MKKALVLLSVFIAALALPLFADDALVMPKGVFRTYITAAYGFGDSHWDKNGDKQDGYDGELPSDKNSLSAINLGLVLEFGINEWITGGIQWAPGINVGAKLDDTGLPYAGDALVNGAYDLQVGAKLQIVGPEGAPVQNDKIRFVVTPGVQIPLGGADFEDEYENITKGDDFIIQDPANHAWGIGGKLDVDYIINEMFFVNAHGQLKYYFERSDVYRSPLEAAMGTKVDVKPGYDLTLEFEPHFGMPLGPGQFSAGLPVTYDKSGESEKDGEGQDNANYRLSIGPSASYLFKVGPLPLETKLGYVLPLAGEKASATNQVVFQLKVYFQF